MEKKCLHIHRFPLLSPPARRAPHAGLAASASLFSFMRAASMRWFEILRRRSSPRARASPRAPPPPPRAARQPRHPRRRRNARVRGFASAAHELVRADGVPLGNELDALVVVDGRVDAHEARVDDERVDVRPDEAAAGEGEGAATAGRGVGGLRVARVAEGGDVVAVPHDGAADGGGAVLVSPRDARELAADLVVAARGRARARRGRARARRARDPPRSRARAPRRAPRASPRGGVRRRSCGAAAPSGGAPR